MAWECSAWEVAVGMSGLQNTPHEAIPARGPDWSLRFGAGARHESRRGGHTNYWMSSAPDNKLILLIEDDVDDERLTLRALRRNNIMNEVVVACDGQEAIDYLFGGGAYAGRDTTTQPAVIVLDLHLPRISGLEVLKRIRAAEETRRIPVVVLTSSEDEAQIEACYESGANSYIRKPTDPSEYSDMVLQVAMYWLLLNRTAAEKLLI